MYDETKCEDCGAVILAGDAKSCRGYDCLCEYCYDTQIEMYEQGEEYL